MQALNKTIFGIIYSIISSFIRCGNCEHLSVFASQFQHSYIELIFRARSQVTIRRSKCISQVGYANRHVIEVDTVPCSLIKQQNGRILEKKDHSQNKLF